MPMKFQKNVKHVRETEIFGLDYTYMTSMPTNEEIAHPNLLSKEEHQEGYGHCLLREKVHI